MLLGRDKEDLPLLIWWQLYLVSSLLCHCLRPLIGCVESKVKIASAQATSLVKHKTSTSDNLLNLLVYIYQAGNFATSLASSLSPLSRVRKTPSIDILQTSPDMIVAPRCKLLSHLKSAVCKQARKYLRAEIQMQTQSIHAPVLRKKSRYAVIIVETKLALLFFVCSRVKMPACRVVITESLRIAQIMNKTAIIPL